MEDHNIDERLEKEIRELEQDPILSTAYRKKNLLQYIVRTFLAIALVYYFWDHTWVRWVGLAYIPLNLLGLGAIFLPQYILKNKIAKAQVTLKEIKAYRAEDEDWA